MKLFNTKKLSLSTQTIRELSGEQLTRVAGGSLQVSISTSVINPSGGITSLNPSGGRYNPSGG